MYTTLREKIAGEKQERLARNARFEELWDAAWHKGYEAAMAAIPKPMTVIDMDGNPVDYVSEGPCGFAWINVPGNSAFGRWLKDKGLARAGYPKGLDVWIGAYSQSHARKSAHAYTTARYLQENGIVCVARSRLD